MARKSKISIGKRVVVKVMHDGDGHWFDPWEETLVGTIVGLPEPTYSNNWNYNPTSFSIRTEDGKIVDIKGASGIKIT